MYIHDPDAPRLWPLLTVVVLMTVLATFLELLYTKRLPELRLIEIGALCFVRIWAASVHNYYLKCYYKQVSMIWLSRMCRRWVTVWIALKIVAFIVSATSA